MRTGDVFRCAPIVQLFDRSRGADLSAALLRGKVPYRSANDPFDEAVAGVAAVATFIPSAILALRPPSFRVNQSNRGFPAETAAACLESPPARFLLPAPACPSSSAPRDATGWTATAAAAPDWCALAYASAGVSTVCARIGGGDLDAGLRLCAACCGRLPLCPPAPEMPTGLAVGGCRGRDDGPGSCWRVDNDA